MRERKQTSKRERWQLDKENEEYVIGQRATRTSGVKEFVELGEIGGDKAAAQNQTDLTRDKERVFNERKGN